MANDYVVTRRRRWPFATPMPPQRAQFDAFYFDTKAEADAKVAEILLTRAPEDVQLHKIK